MNTKDVDRKVEVLVEALHNVAIDNEGGDCDGCRFSHRDKQPHGEWTCECLVPAPKDCPVVEQIAAALYNHVMVLVKKP